MSALPSDRRQGRHLDWRLFSNPMMVSKHSRIINRMKAALIRLGIRGFNPKLKRGRRDPRDAQLKSEDQPHGLVMDSLLD